MARNQPNTDWHLAADSSWWSVTGTTVKGDSVSNALALASSDGTNPPVFHVVVVTGNQPAQLSSVADMTAAAVTAATPMVLVDAVAYQANQDSKQKWGQQDSQTASIKQIIAQNPNPRTARDLIANAVGVPAPSADAQP